MRFEIFDLNNVDFLSVLDKFKLSENNKLNIISAYRKWESLYDYFAYNIIGRRFYEATNPFLSFIYSCYYTDTKHKEALSKIEELESETKKKSDQLEQVEAVMLYLSREIDELKEHNKCLSARLYELEK